MKFKEIKMGVLDETDKVMKKGLDDERFEIVGEFWNYEQKQTLWWRGLKVKYGLNPNGLHFIDKDGNIVERIITQEEG